MAKSIIAHPAQESTTRKECGRQLYRAHADDIRFDPVEKVWLVPSQNDATSLYEVTLGRRGEFCECKDFEYRSPAGGCVHIIAATLARAKTFRCEGCGDRFPNWERVEVHEETLTWFGGEALCRSCAQATGLI